MRILTSLAIAFILQCAASAADLPTAVAMCLKKAPSYTISDKANNSYLQGDFDGDGLPDYAVVVSRGPEQGILVCRAAAAASPIVLGAGTAFHGMTNLDFTAWHPHEKRRRVARGAGQHRIPVLLGDALLLEWESASGLVYWNGTRFVWYQQGD
jgi:hypothetical protein